MGKIIIISYFGLLQMGKRQIKKTVVRYQEKEQRQVEVGRDEQERQRSREKEGIKGSHKESIVKVEEVNVNSRKARLEAMRKARQGQQVQMGGNEVVEIIVKLEEPIIKPVQNQILQKEPVQPTKPAVKKEQVMQPEPSSENQEQEDDEEDQQKEKVIRKPIFISKQYRDPNNNDEDDFKEQQRKRKNVRYTTKMLLEQQRYENDSQQENDQTDSQNENNFNGINDDDTADEELQFQKWKIRELGRIRKAWQERNKHEMERAQIDRRRKMTNEAILIENKNLGSDANQNQTQTKYAFMQKYYHRGAFYQDDDDQVFKRDYNLPTPMEMQDKSLLPKLLQKRVGNFGKKGQSKYTHLTNEDTSDLNPLTRADQSLLDYWKKKTAGYKGAHNKNV